MYRVDSFGGTPHPFPEHDINPAEKGKEWTLKFLRAIYADYLSDGTSLGYSKIEEMKRFRLYGAGEQSNEQYKDYILGQKNKDGKRKGYAHINWDIFSPWPKFINVVVGMFESLEHDIVVDAIDSKSGAEKEELMWKAWYRKVHGAWEDAIKQSTGIPTDTSSFTPENFEELEMYRDMGGFKIKAEILIEKLIRATENFSDISQMKRKVIEDFVNLNRAAVSTVVDPVSKKVLYEYEDPIYCGMQYSRKWDYTNSQYAYKFLNLSVLEIRDKFVDLTEEQIRGIAISFGPYLNNLNGHSFDRYDIQIDGGGFGYDDFKVPCLVGYYRTRDMEVIKKKVSKFGEERYYKEDYSKVGSPETSITNVHKIYQGTWILGTEHVCDIGPMRDMIRPETYSVDFPIKCYQLPGKSLTATVVPNLDNIALNFYRFQDAIATSPKPGLAVEFSSLQNISLGSGELKPLEILKIRRQTGDLIYKATTHSSRSATNTGRPVYPIEGGLGGQLEEFIRIFEYNFEVIRTLTGINRLADGSAPKPSDQVGTSNLAVIGTENALKPIYSGYLYLKEKLAQHAILRIEGLVKKNQKAYEIYSAMLGKQTIEVLKITPDDICRQFALALRARLTEQMKQAIRTAAFEAMKPGKNGNSALTMADYMFIESELEKGNIKYAQAVINHKIRKAQELEAKQAQENQERQSQALQELEMVKAQNEQTKVELDIKKINAEWDRRDRHEVLKNDSSLQQIVLQTELNRDITPQEEPSEEKEFAQT
jgi:arginine repressor